VIEKNLKIGQYLANTWTKVSGLLFWAILCTYDIAEHVKSPPKGTIVWNVGARTCPFFWEIAGPGGGAPDSAKVNEVLMLKVR